MPIVAKAVSAALTDLRPNDASYFHQRLTTFLASLKKLDASIAAFRSKFRGVKVATTEPVGDYLLEALGLQNETPFPFQADIMNGIDPSPEDISIQQKLFTSHEVKVFCYNEQVSSPVTIALRNLAKNSHVATVALYETMPVPGYNYQSWMNAEINDIAKAIEFHRSTNAL